MNIRYISCTFVLILLCSQWVHARKVEVLTVPQGALIEIANADEVPSISMGTTYTGPAVIDFRSSRTTYLLRVSKEGFETELFEYEYYKNKSTRVEIELAPLSLVSNVAITSIPAGAEVRYRGIEVGVTPCSVELVFDRESKKEDWAVQELEISKVDYFDQSIDVLSTDRRREISLAKSRDEKEVLVTVVSSETKRSVSVPVSYEGEIVGSSPAIINLEFLRESPAQNWPERQISAELLDQYQKSTVSVSHEQASAAEVEISVAPVVEVRVSRLTPFVDRSGTIPIASFDESTTLATLEVLDDSSPAVDLRQVTHYDRFSVLRSINSYCVTNDGQQIVFAVTQKGRNDRFASNLFIKNSSGQSKAFSQLTHGDQYVDCYPASSTDEGDSIIVFQSNRGLAPSFDISSIKLSGGKVVGGVRQLTRDEKQNIAPAFLSSRDSVYYSSYEIRAISEPIINSVRLDGAFPTNLNEIGEQLHVSLDNRILFQRFAEITGKRQLYSMTTDGLQYSTILTDPHVSGSNCTEPNLSRDGKKLLFVSDASPDRLGRSNTNIFLYEFETGFVQQLTDNGSDDLMPVWSPIDPSVVFFLSNRGGAFNVWRMALPGI